MNWYKWAQAKTLEEMLLKLESDPNVGPEIVEWIRTLPNHQKGPAIGILKSAPNATKEQIEAKLNKKTSEPITEEETIFINNFTYNKELMNWIIGILTNLKGEKRKKAFEIIKEKGGRIRDWSERTHSTLRGRTLENAIEETERWHTEQAQLAKGEYTKTLPQNITINYSDTGHTWQRITSGIDAKIEGNKMNHCVGSYCEDVENEKINVYSLRDKNNTPIITAGFKYDNLVVVQMKGKDDIDPTEEWHQEIKDLLTKLGTRYNDGEYYIKNEEFGLKNLDELTMLDIQSSPFLQKVINDAIIREGEAPHFAQGWAISVMESGKAPKEWIDAAAKNIAITGKSPSFMRKELRLLFAIEKTIPPQIAEAVEKFIQNKINYALENDFRSEIDSDIAKAMLEHRQISQKSLDLINKHIKEFGQAPNFAFEWAELMLMTGRAPKEWTDIITERMNKYGHVPGFSRRWVEKVFDQGKAPKEWTEGTITMIYAKGHVPSFANSWISKSILDGSAPQSIKEALIKNVKSTYNDNPAIGDWLRQIVLTTEPLPEEIIDHISRYILDYGRPPNYAENWASYMLEKDKLPEFISKAIINYISARKFRAIDDFIKSWIIKQLKTKNPPEILKLEISDYLLTSGSLPAFLINWAKEEMNSGNPPEYLEKSVSEYIKRWGQSPGFAEEWASKAVQSFKFLEKWIDVILLDVKKHGVLPEFARKTITNILYSNNREILESNYYHMIKEAITVYLLQTGNVPGFAFGWVRDLLNNNQAPKTWIQFLLNQIGIHASPPDFARDWAEKIMSGPNPPLNWINQVNRTIKMTKFVPIFAIPWAKKQDWWKKDGWRIDEQGYGRPKYEKLV